MMRATVLLADNNRDELNLRRTALEEQGYRVITADTPEAATTCLQRGDITVAVLDLRLSNDQEGDVSGFVVATTIAPAVPKIILSAFPSFEAARSVLKLRGEGLPPAVDFVSKQEGLDALVDAVQHAIRMRSSYKDILNRFIRTLDADYEDARRQAFWTFVVSGLVGLVAVGIVFWAALRPTDNAWLSGLAGTITAVVSGLFYRRSDTANERMDRYHQECLEMRHLEMLLAACDDLENEELQHVQKAAILAAASVRWLGATCSLPGVSRRPPQPSPATARK